jgi:MFS family permease
VSVTSAGSPVLVGTIELKDLTANERSTFWAAFGGYALDGMDFQLYGLVIPTLLAVWSMSRADAGLIGTVAILTSAFGGWIGGIFADRYGRVLTLQITIAWFSVFTALSGLAHSPSQLLMFRALHGIGFGAEWAVGATLLSETIRPELRGRMLGLTQSSWAVGWAAALLLYTLSFSAFEDTIAWRLLFLVGLAPAVFIFFLRKYISDPPIFKAASKDRSKNRLAQLFSRSVLPITFLTSLLATGVQGGYYGVMIWLPTYLREERHLTTLGTSGYISVVILSSFVGYVSAAFTLDKLGRRRTFILFSLGATVTVVLYTFIPINDSVTLLLGVPLGYFAAGVSSGCGAYFSELFPTIIRAAGLGFSYNFGRAVGALFPFLVGLLSTHLALGLAIGMFTTAAYSLIWISIIFLPETKGAALS